MFIVEEICTEGDIRLGFPWYRNSYYYKGRVEVCHNNTWGAVCKGLGGPDNARVACRQLGLRLNRAVSFQFSVYRRGTEPIWLNRVSCTGSETQLTDCPNDGFGHNNCSYDASYAGVICDGKKFYGVNNRLFVAYRNVIIMRR